MGVGVGGGRARWGRAIVIFVRIRVPQTGSVRVWRWWRCGGCGPVAGGGILAVGGIFDVGREALRARSGRLCAVVQALSSVGGDGILGGSRGSHCDVGELELELDLEGEVG